MEKTVELKGRSLQSVTMAANASADLRNYLLGYLDAILDGKEVAVRVEVVAANLVYEDPLSEAKEVVPVGGKSNGV